MFTIQQIIIQSPHLINTAQCSRGHFELDEFIEYLGIEDLVLYIGGPFATCLFEGEGDVVAEADVAAVEEASGGAGGAGADLCGGWLW
mmetsp:Transcript_6221/g.7841  ORF Transcript_6221/g.7841 Transcript_6221/m.7841 type:complete len:88 (-) Transcript_6221:219-482(-)